MDETLLDLRAYSLLGGSEGMYRVHRDDIVWRVVSLTNNDDAVAYLLDNGDVFVEQAIARYWVWWDRWVGPFTSEDAACAALSMML